MHLSLLRPVTLAFLVALAASGEALAADCKPDALGTSRVIAVDPAEHGRIGSMQYGETLPLNDHEVVLTFDDGPLPPRTNKVLDILSAECVRATFFLVGQMANAFPTLVRRELADGHTIATHTQTHSPRIWKWPSSSAYYASLNAARHARCASTGGQIVKLPVSTSVARRNRSGTSIQPITDKLLTAVNAGFRALVGELDANKDALKQWAEGITASGGAIDQALVTTGTVIGAHCNKASAGTTMCRCVLLRRF